MRADLEVTLIHDGEAWVARNGDLEARGRTLPELDADLKRAMQACGEFEEGSKVTVFMGFDYDTIPTWIRQYASHYFNRYVFVNL